MDSQKLNKRRTSVATEPEAHEDDTKVLSPRKNRSRSAAHYLNAFYKFCYPYSIVSTVILVVSTSLNAVQDLSDFHPTYFASVIEGTFAIVLSVIFMVGINQVCDVEIDKINKPDLPLAAGDFSIATGIWISWICAAMSFVVAWLIGSWYLFLSVFAYVVGGVIYSVDLPLMRWKESSILATTLLISARLTSIQIAFYLHMQTFVFGRPAVFSKASIFGISIIVVFSIVTSLFKDIPDIEGDRKNGIITFAVRLGEKKMFRFCVWLLEAAFVVAMLVGATSSITWSRYSMVVGHGVMALMLWQRAKNVDIQDKKATFTFYMFLWQLMSVEYMLIPLLR